MKILVVGAAGNMGRRYCAILRHCGIDFDGVDIGDRIDYAEYDGAIYATPTLNHLSDIEYHHDRTAIPMLIEKPISTTAVLTLPSDLKIMMINQYRHLYSRGSEGPTSYNFFKTGSDGIEWDCINIIGLARGSVQLKNDSPIWDCQINGRRISISDMDLAYIDNIIRFVRAIENWDSLEWMGESAYILDAHRKVRELIEKGNYEH